ncbi:hypothetical protein B0H17DRAFT_1197597 [Mycena rosella]|uniref:Uncharacterized protein n=1 Tax=Mycena rosella TaxID=1033263 RepID=A0AAD7GLZ8_MYCRO|nr:hypothetical protein B0H17DRAFT_1197597 [Mycena rosella]
MSSVVANSCYANIAGLMLFNNPRKISPRVTIVDVYIYIGPTEDDTMLLSGCHFNDTDEPVTLEDGINYAQITVAKRENAYDVMSNTPGDFSLVGDIKDIFETSAPPRRCTMHITGVAIKRNEAAGTFEMDVEQYTLAAAQAKKAEIPTSNVGPAPPSIFPLLGVFATSSRYKKKKPVPFVNRFVTVTGYLAGTEDVLEEGGKVKQRFRVQVENISFQGSNGPSGPPPKSTPAPVASGSGSGSVGRPRFSSYTNKKRKTDDVDSTPPTSSPSPHPSSLPA